MFAYLNNYPLAGFVLFDLPKRRNAPAAANTFAVVIKGLGRIVYPHPTLVFVEVSAPEIERMLIECRILVAVGRCCIAGKQAVCFLIFGSRVTNVIKGFVSQKKNGYYFLAIGFRANIKSHFFLIFGEIIVKTDIYDTVNREKVEQKTCRYQNKSKNRRDHGTDAKNLFSKFSSYIFY